MTPRRQSDKADNSSVRASASHELQGYRGRNLRDTHRRFNRLHKYLAGVGTVIESHQDQEIRSGHRKRTIGASVVVALGQLEIGPVETTKSPIGDEQDANPDRIRTCKRATIAGEQPDTLIIDAAFEGTIISLRGSDPVLPGRLIADLGNIFGPAGDGRQSTF